MRFGGVEKASILGRPGRPIKEREVSHGINGRTAACLWIIKWSPSRDIRASVGWYQSAAEMVGCHQGKVSKPRFSADPVCRHRAAPEDETDIMRIGIGGPWSDQTHSLDRQIKKLLFFAMQVSNQQEAGPEPAEPIAMGPSRR
jgi:hypothetical protein